MAIQSQLKKRKWLALPIAASLLLGAAIAPISMGTVQAEGGSSQSVLQLKPMKIMVGGKLLNVPAGMATGNETYVALSFLSKELGLMTNWDAETRTISVSSKNKTMEMGAGGNYYWINNNRIFGSPPIVREGTTYLPLRLLLEHMGFAIGYDAKAKVISIQAIPENDLKVTSQSFSEESEYGTVDVQYPQIEGFANKDVQSKINRTLKSKAEAYIQSGQDLLSGYVDFAKEMGDEAPSMTFDVGYTVTYNEKNKLSLQFFVYEYSGGAHGMYDYQPHNFNLETGEEITLKEAALGNTNYIRVINEEIKKQIKAQDLPLLSPFETIQPDQRYYLRGDAIIVFFSLYEYTPYAAGIPEFSIPLSKLR
ncbi:hypothetical protein PAECIP111893_02820 [Paenibacillus plantiphilus]|uniref:Copper amine oxidase N-terminal domain-containing protein n=1 Tax=Paenibacillus plantiphilus TaxID=2905650 RepID=A0ABM9CC28_9BACL|nr:stalk domain-containing protein [Paenibacillus plantiphilus]CAH1208004.1 hypothetical protein PAECIP111893_02820 [Paenibacillus plantiphilus]